jgi:hypothetical protein
MHFWNTHGIIIIVTFLVLVHLTNGNENDYERIWYHGMGNAFNTHRRVPSIPTNYTGKSWQLVFNAARGLISIPGMATGINGDIYLFTSDDPSKSR